jgi:hypothetical protein
MRGRYLLGLSNANRQAASVVIGDEVEVGWNSIPIPMSWWSPRTSPARSMPIQSPARRMPACPTVANASMCALLSAKKPETRIRRIAQLQLRAERVHEPFAPARIQQPPVKLVDLELITDPELRPARPVVRFVECRIAALRSTCARSLADLTRHPPASSRALSAKPALAAELRLDHARPPG